MTTRSLVCGTCGSALSMGPAGFVCAACALETAFAALDDGVDDEPREGFPRQFGDYELLEEIGHGGMGLVFKARQRSLDRIVALKLLLTGRFSDEHARRRFRIEAESAARLQHPNIVATHEIGEAEGHPYLTMEFVDGGNLAELCHAQPLPAKTAARYVRDVARAIHAAHKAGVLHRDLKPSNVLVGGDDRPRVTDFGLARRIDETAGALTLTGQILGSPNYAAPEQAAGKHAMISAATDVYGLGALLYHLLTGRAPFDAPTPAETLRLVLDTEPIAPRTLQPKTSRNLETICLKCLRKEPAHRYASAAEVADECERFLTDAPIHARPASRVEIAWRWCRRRPAIAALVVGSAGAVVALGLQLRALRAMEARVTQWENEALTAFPAAQARARETLAGQDANREELEARAIAALAQKLGLDEHLLQKRLPKFADELRLAADASPLNRASAAFFARDYVEAERLAEEAVLEAQQKQPTDRATAIAALELAAAAARERNLPAAALRYYEQAGQLTDRTTEPLMWARVQTGIGRALELQGRYAEAESVFRAALDEQLRAGDETRETVATHSAITRVMFQLERHDEVEAACRTLLPLAGKLLGPEDPETLAVRNLIANVFLRRGQSVEAEAEYRAIASITKRTLGAEHSDTLRSRANLALALSQQGRHDDAATIQRSVVAALERTIGAGHTRAMVARFNLGLILASGRQLAEAQQEFQFLVASMQQYVQRAPGDDLLWGKPHLAYYQLFARDFAGALATSEAVLREKPLSLVAQTNRAHALLFLGRTGEAEQLYLGFRGENMERSSRNWESAILADFDELEEGGLTHPAIPRLRALLKSTAQ